MSDPPHSPSPLRYENVSVRFPGRSGTITALEDFSLDLAGGEVLALAGESGSGKSTAGFAAGGLLPETAAATGTVHLGADRIEAGDPEGFLPFRGRRIGFVFQEPSTALHPSLRVGTQIAEALRPPPPRRDRNRRVEELVRSVRLEPTRALLRAYPHHLSGGMQQRVVLAIALANRPAVVVADEPTTALDPTLRREILTLLRSHAVDRGGAVLLISHDLGIVAHFADRVAILLGGKIVESGPCREVLSSPRHEYTRSLLESARLTAGGALP